MLQNGRENDKKKSKKERKEGKEERKTRRKENKFVERKKRKRRKKEREKEDFPAFGRSKFDGSRIIVGARSTIYVWTPKSWSFDKLHKVRYFPTWFTFSLKDI